MSRQAHWPQGSLDACVPSHWPPEAVSTTVSAHLHESESARRKELIDEEEIATVALNEMKRVNAYLDTMMDELLFALLAESIEQMGEITRGERSPSRVSNN